MSNNQFDEQLRNIITDEHIPYNKDNWNALQERLDKGRQNKAVLLLLPVYYKAAAAACIAALACFAWKYTNKNETILPVAKQQSSIIHPIAPGIKPYNNAIAPVAIAHTKQAIVKPAFATTIQEKKTDQTETQPAAISVVATEQEQKPTISITTEQKNKRDVNKLNIVMDAVTQTSSNINLAVNGGYALIQSGNGLSAGMTIRNRISDKISFEANIGYIQGNQAIPQTQTMGSVAPYDGTGSGQPGEHVSAASVGGSKTIYNYQQRNLPYLQLTPGVNLKMNKKLSGTLGVDVQKILLDKATLSSLNEDLAATSKKIPSVDPGIMLKGNLGLTKRIGCGIAYRKSMVNLTDPGNNYINRDYVLFQVQYTIIK